MSNVFIRYIVIVGLFFNINLSVFALTERQARNFFHLNSRHAVKFLNIKGYQQSKDYTCGPAAVMSVLRYYRRLDEHQMNKMTEMKIAKEMGTTEDEGTSEKQIVDWLNDHGFSAQVHYNGSIKTLRQNLAKGRPAIVNWIDWGGHWVATAGYVSAKNDQDRSRDILFFADPAAHFEVVKTKDGITFINPERFSSMWFNSKHQKNIYVIAIPK